MSTDHHPRAHLFALLTTAVWGLTFISTKTLLDTVAPLEIIFYRFVLAVVVLCILSPRPFRHGGGWRTELLFAGAGFTGIVLYFALENTALLHSYASNVGVIICTAPFFSALTARIFLKEPLSPNFVLGFFVALVGVTVLTVNGATFQGLHPAGDIMALCAAFSWGLFTVLSRKIFDRGFPLLPATRRIIEWGVIEVALFFTLRGDASVLIDTDRLADPEVYGNLLFLGVVASGLCYVTWNYANSHLGPIKSTLYIYLSPAVTVMASVAVLGERFNFLSLLGMMLVLTGLLVAAHNLVLTVMQIDLLHRQTRQFRQFGVRGKGFSIPENILVRTLKAIHLLAATAWAGGALSLQALGFFKINADDPCLHDHIAECIHLVDTYVVMPGLMGCILTGLVYSLATPLGFFRYIWIAYKWLVCLCAACLGTFFWGPWGNEVIASVGSPASDILTIIRGCLVPENMWEGAIQLTLILSMCLISVYRPRSIHIGKLRFPLRRQYNGKIVFFRRPNRRRLEKIREDGDE